MARVLASSTARGYGIAHQRLRKLWAVRVERGEVACRRCGRLIRPGSLWDLGHDDFDRSPELCHPEHRHRSAGGACLGNRATATYMAQRRRAPGLVQADWW